MNRIILAGRLTRDPELRQTQSGASVASFTIAVNRIGKDAKADFIDCVAWNGTADFVKKYFVKGQQILVEGRLQIREWVDKAGAKRRSAEVIADGVEFCGAREKRAEEPKSDADFDDLDEDLDELPF